MSPLAQIILNALTENKSVWLKDDDGSSLHLTALGSVTVVEGSGVEYIQAIKAESTILYNFNRIKVIEIN